jgi:hypothetical protein
LYIIARIDRFELDPAADRAAVDHGELAHAAARLYDHKALADSWHGGIDAGDLRGPAQGRRAGDDEPVGLSGRSRAADLDVKPARGSLRVVAVDGAPSAVVAPLAVSEAPAPEAVSDVPGLMVNLPLITELPPVTVSDPPVMLSAAALLRLLTVVLPLASVTVSPAGSICASSAAVGSWSLDQANRRFIALPPKSG